jgi:hypothetical protein
MATNVVRECIIYRTGVVLKITRNLISVECVWDIILPKWLFHTKPHLPSISQHHLNPKIIEIVSFHTDAKSSGMDTVLNEHTPFIFWQPPEDASSIFLWNTATQTTCYSNLDHSMLLHLCEHLKSRTSKYKWQKCGWFMLGTVNDKYHVIFFTNTVFNAAVFCTTSVWQFLLCPQMKQERKEIWQN